MALSPCSRLAPLVLLALALPHARPDEAAEPAQRFVLEIGDRQVEVVAGETFDLTLGDTTHRARLMALPHKSLRLAELTFDYPVHLSFEYEASDGLEIWTLDGRDAVLMVYRFEIAAPPEVYLELFAAGVRESFPDAPFTEERADLRLEGRDVAGQRLTWSISGIENVQEAYVLDPSGPARRLVVLQDTLSPGEQGSDEFRELRELLQRTYRWTSE